jgi:hypothetical protein
VCVINIPRFVLRTGPQLLNRFLHTVRSSASSFNFQYSLFSLRSSYSCLRLLPRIPVTSTFPLSFLQKRVLEVYTIQTINCIPLFSLRSSYSCLRLLPRIPVTSTFPLSKRVLEVYTIQTINCIPLFSLRSSHSCLRLLPRIPVTSTFPLSFLQNRVLEMYTIQTINCILKIK